MEQDEEFDEQVSRYIHNKMDQAERSNFEARLNAEPLLKKVVEQCQQLKLYFNKDLVDLKRSLKEAELRYRKKSTVATEDKGSALTRGNNRWLALACFVLVILIAGLFYMNQSSRNIVQLAKESSLNGLNKGSSRKGDSIAVADVLFYRGSYQEYIQKAFSLLKDDPDSIERSILHINIAKSYMQLNRADSVISFYNSLNKSEKNYCYLQYQVALAYVINNNKQEAIRFFQIVTNAGCFPVDKKAAEWINILK